MTIVHMLVQVIVLNQFDSRLAGTDTSFPRRERSHADIHHEFYRRQPPTQIPETRVRMDYLVR